MLVGGKKTCAKTFENETLQHIIPSSAVQDFQISEKKKNAHGDREPRVQEYTRAYCSKRNPYPRALISMKKDFFP